MACDGSSKDCETIYNKTYPKLIKAVDTSLNGVSSGISDIASSLSSLSVPDDYLGRKVKRELDNLTKDFANDEELVKAEKTSVDGFVDGKIKEHKAHRKAYLEEQARLAALAKQKAEEEASGSSENQTDNSEEHSD